MFASSLSLQSPDGVLLENVWVDFVFSFRQESSASLHRSTGQLQFCTCFAILEFVYTSSSNSSSNRSSSSSSSSMVILL